MTERLKTTTAANGFQESKNGQAVPAACWSTCRSLPVRLTVRTMYFQQG